MITGMPSARGGRPRRRRPDRGSPRVASTGGMKTCRRPSRGSTQSAVRTIRRLIRRGAGAAASPSSAGVGCASAAVAGRRRARGCLGAPARPARPSGERRQRRARRRTDRARSTCARIAGRDPRQRVERQAIARSANRRGSGTGARERRNHGPLAQRRRPSASSRRAAAARSRRRCSRPCSKTRASRARSSASVELDSQRIDVDRQPPLAPQVVPGVLVGRAARSRGRRRAARRARSTNALRVAVAVAVVASSRRRSATVVVPDRLAVACASSSRAPSAAAARPDTTCPGRSGAGRPARSAPCSRRAASPASSRLRGPSAAVFHSAPSGSSMLATRTSTAVKDDGPRWDEPRVHTLNAVGDPLVEARDSPRELHLRPMSGSPCRSRSRTTNPSIMVRSMWKRAPSETVPGAVAASSGDCRSRAGQVFHLRRPMHRRPTRRRPFPHRHSPPPRGDSERSRPVSLPGPSTGNRAPRDPSRSRNRVHGAAP